MKEFKPEYIAFEMKCEQDIYPPKASLEFPEDIKAAKNAIRRGDVWGWGLVKIEGRYPHPVDSSQSLHAVDWLGGCMYASRKDFIENSGYYEDMKSNVTEVLRAKWEAAQR